MKLHSTTNRGILYRLLFGPLFALPVVMCANVQAEPVDFTLPDMENKPHKLSDYRGKWVVVNYWATWCPPCIQEIPSFIELQDSYKAKGFSVVAFSVDDGDPAALYKLIEKYGINYPVLLADLDISRGFGGVSGIPVTFLVNRQGEIVKKYLGYVEHDVLEEEIKKMLAAG